MVAEFARDHYHLPEGQVGDLMSRVREGDMSMILKAYEEEIKHPLRNAVKGIHTTMAHTCGQDNANIWKHIL